MSAQRKLDITETGAAQPEARYLAGWLRRHADGDGSDRAGGAAL